MGRLRKMMALTAAAGILVWASCGTALGSPAAAGSAARASGALPGPAQVVSYRGLQVQVPASWHVYRLGADPSRCVLFNEHAVYLGSPGADQQCPVRAFGRTEALLVQPLGRVSGLPPQTSWQRGTAVTLPTGALAAQDSADGMIRIALPTSGVLVTATYGTDPALIRAILAGARATAVARAAPAGPAHSAGREAARKGLSRSGMTGRTTAGNAAVSSPELTGLTGSGLGFDTCTAPSLANMTGWLDSLYRVVGTYLGGDSWACTTGNLSRTWVSQVAAQGWRFMPLWVGPQAPCSTIPGVVHINPSQAAAEGRSQATSAAAAASGFGFGKGAPIYFDMEGYNNTIKSCSQAVLTFLDSWTQGLHAAGYASGVYSSAASGVADLASRYGQSGYSSPDDIWFADWNANPALTDSYLPANDWPGQRRLHQYNGSNTETWGGASLDVDNDVVGGAVAGLSSSSAPYVVSQPDAVNVAPGSSGKVTLAFADAGSPAGAGAAVHWQAGGAAGLTLTPDQGTVTPSKGHPVTVTLRVTASRSVKQGRYNLPVTGTASGRSLPATSELVSAAAGSLSATEPIVLYAAYPDSMKIAAQIARQLALPAADLTGTFRTAWADTADGRHLVLAVGQAALNALYYNPCGWSNPAGTGSGTTPFAYTDGPSRQSPGKNTFENSESNGLTAITQLTEDLTHYALAGSVPDQGPGAISPSFPAKTCIGSPSVAVP